MPALEDHTGNSVCFALLPETYRIKGCEDLCTIELSVVFPLHTAFNLSLPHSFPPGACRQYPQPCCTLQRSRSWAELSLASTARLLGAASIPGARPSSAAEDQPKASHSLPLLGSLEMSQGLQS